jgi:enoyl-CoA hydratase/carnithine racemase
VTVVKYQVADNFARLTINRAEAYSSINNEVKESVCGSVRDLYADGQAAVLIVTGGGASADCARSMH